MDPTRKTGVHQHYFYQVLAVQQMNTVQGPTDMSNVKEESATDGELRNGKMPGEANEPKVLKNGLHFTQLFGVLKMALNFHATSQKPSRPLKKPAGKVE